jgi:ankyrin repeat protein
LELIWTKLHHKKCELIPGQYGCFDPRNGGNISVLQYLLSQKGINGNIKGQFGSTLLHYACGNINKLPLEIFKVLIERIGCDVNAQNNFKINSLHYSINSFNPDIGGDIEVLTYLLTQKNVIVNIKCNSGSTLLHYACEKVNKLPIDIFKLLIETHGGDVNAQDNNKDTPIHCALCTFNPRYDGDITTLTYLITQKGVNVKGQYGNTILHYACGNINSLPLDVFKTLIETQGCDVNVQNDSNNTPLHLAFRYFDPNNDSNITVFAYLINQNNFNVNIKGRNGCTFLHLACTWDASNLDDDMDSDLINVPYSEDDWDVLKAKSDTVLSQIVEIIVERCGEQVFNESSP